MFTIKKIENSPPIIYYDKVKNDFGTFFIASTDQGICTLHFESDENQFVYHLQGQFPHATICRDVNQPIKISEQILLNTKKEGMEELVLHLQASDFQLAVWHKLLAIPFGELTSYYNLASLLGSPKLARAVGGAVGKNPVAILIPCHRVIYQSGKIGGYRWGIERKKQLIQYEQKENNKTFSTEISE